MAPILSICGACTPISRAGSRAANQELPEQAAGAAARQCGPPAVTRARARTDRQPDQRRAALLWCGVTTRPLRRRRSAPGYSRPARPALDLRDQAVLVRSAHHSDVLEIELTARGIPFVKYGGLRFTEAAHVRDFLAALRVITNPADDIAWFRVLRLHDGIGPAHARRISAALHLTESSAAEPDGTQPEKRSRRRGARSFAGGTGGHPVRPRRGRAARGHRRAGRGRPGRPRPAAPGQVPRRGRQDRRPAAADRRRCQPPVAARRARRARPRSASVSLRPGGSAPAGRRLPGHLHRSTRPRAWSGRWSTFRTSSTARCRATWHWPARLGLEEERRLFYVAVTRARDELYPLRPAAPASPPHRARRPAQPRPDHQVPRRSRDGSLRHGGGQPESPVCRSGWPAHRSDRRDPRRALVRLTPGRRRARCSG